jgi:hypothetical protein
MGKEEDGSQISDPGPPEADLKRNQCPFVSDSVINLLREFQLD